MKLAPKCQAYLQDACACIQSVESQNSKTNFSNQSEIKVKNIIHCTKIEPKITSIFISQNCKLILKRTLCNTLFMPQQCLF